jgi:hypothetical protein
VVSSEKMRVGDDGNVGIGTTAPGQKLSVAGTIESTSGGFMFPDGTTQATAAAGGGGGTVTSVGSGTGLTGGPITTAGTLSLDTAFTDGRYALLVHGHDVSQVTGAARLVGGNSFFDNQSISGNLSLTGSINNALRLETTTGAPNLIGGDTANWVTSGVVGATISGGGPSGTPDPASANRVTDALGTVGGGATNQAGDNDTELWNAAIATVAGGAENTAGNWAATVGGGQHNTASSVWGVVAGGNNNQASGQASTVSGGDSNTASGLWATVPGGDSNAASGMASFAAGNRAKAVDGGSFVWGDATGADVTSAGWNTFVVRASGGAFFSHSLQAASFIGDGSGLTNVTAGTASNLECAGCVSPPELDFVPATQAGLDAEAVARASADTTLQAGVEARVLKSGDTMAGTLNLPANGLVAGTDQLVLSGGNVGVGTASPGEKLTVAGTVHSTSGGYKFPDGTTQTTAAGEPILVLVDDFDDPTLAPKVWSTYTTGAGSVTVSESRVGMQTDGANTAILYGRKQYSVSDGTLIFKAKVSAYSDGSVYGDRQPRGLVAGTDRNNAIEFISASPTSITARTVSGGTATQTTFSLTGQAVVDWAFYQIVATPSVVKFYFDGALVATHTTNIPTAALNVYIGTVSDVGGNIPISAEYVSFERRM